MTFKLSCSYCSDVCGVHLVVLIWGVVLDVGVCGAYLVVFIWVCGIAGVHLEVFIWGCDTRSCLDTTMALP